jgi:hypothetical protein
MLMLALLPTCLSQRACQVCCTHVAAQEGHLILSRFPLGTRTF